MEGGTECWGHGESLMKHWTRELLPLPEAPKTTMLTEDRCMSPAALISD